MEKARSIFNYIQAEASDNSETFVASRGWFNRFKHRNNLHKIKISGEATSGGTKAATEFPAILKTIIEQGYCPPELVFNVDGACLFRKRIPKNERFYPVKRNEHPDLKLEKIVSHFYWVVTQADISS